MYSLIALVATITACVIAHPPGVRDASNDPMSIGNQPLEHINRKSVRDYLISRYYAKRTQYPAIDERIPYPRPKMPASDWLNQEIDRINQMQDRSSESLPPYKSELPGWLSHESYKRILFGPVGPYGEQNRIPPYYEYPQLTPLKEIMAASNIPRKHAKILHPILETTTETHKITEIEIQKEPQVFALTPLDKGYFEPTEKYNLSNNSLAGIPEGHHEGGGHEDLKVLEMHRQIRQNPNHSRTKTLVSEDLAKLRQGLDSDNDSTDKPKHIRVLGSEFARGSVYAVGIAASVGTVIILAVLGFAFGWYTISKRAKAAADVDYPAYGVTGPTVDTSGDRKLAHSAQMYHYQHQKQQIIAMERNNAEQRDGSISDPESEENEEGDYTVYECPGFATTGDLEVENPLFNEESTPAVIGNVASVEPQSKE